MEENEIVYYYDEVEDWYGNNTSTQQSTTNTTTQQSTNNTTQAEQIIQNNDDKQAFFADADVSDVELNTNTVTQDNLVLQDMTINIKDQTQWGLAVKDGSGFSTEALDVSDRLGQQNVRKDFSTNLETFIERENSFVLAQPTKIVTLQEVGLPQPVVIKPNPYIPLIFGCVSILLLFYLTITKTILKRRILAYESYQSHRQVIDEFKLEDFNIIDDDLFEDKGVDIV